MSTYQQAAANVRPPMKSGDHMVQQISTSNVATESALTLPKGKYYVTFEALSADCYIIFKAATSTANVTTTTGYCIPAGQERHWFIESNRLGYIETITSAGTGTLKYYVSSQTFEKPV